MKKAFTLIELLVVIAIIAILAAILFPVFAQAKAAAKKTASLSNVKQQTLGATMYAGDADDLLPDVPVIDAEAESYVFAAKINPYVKNAQLWADPASPYKMGSVQHGIVDYPLAIGSTVYMKAPDDPCVGLPKSQYETSGYSYPGTSGNYYKDIYPAIDYIINPDLWAYKANGCPMGGLTNGYSHPGPNMTSGAGGGDGQNGIGNAGSMTWTSVSKVILLINAPTDNTWEVGTSDAARSFWGKNWKGMHNGISNVGFMDGHAKGMSYGALHPNNLVDRGDQWKCANCSNAQYVSPASDAGTLWFFNGTTFADAAHQ